MLHPSGNLRCVLMFPGADHRPALGNQRGPELSISLTVTLNFRSPVFSIGLRWLMMLRTAMPETPIDKNCHPGPRKNDIGRVSPLRHRAVVHPIPQTTSVKNRAKLQLRPGIAAAIGLHLCAGRWAGRPRFGASITHLCWLRPVGVGRCPAHPGNGIGVAQMPRRRYVAEAMLGNQPDKRAARYRGQIHALREGIARYPANAQPLGRCRQRNHSLTSDNVRANTSDRRFNFR